MKEYKGIERRRYIRLKSVFPVEFKLLSLDGKKELSDFRQGFTSDVSKGGILLRINRLEPELLNILEKKEARLLLNIDIPVAKRPIEAVAEMAWMTVIKEREATLCLIGLSFVRIENKDRRRLVSYASSLYRMPKLAAIALSLMLVVIGIDRAREAELERQNELLSGRLIETLQKRYVIMESLDLTAREKDILLARLREQGRDIEDIESAKAALLKKDKKLKATVSNLKRLKDELDKSQSRQAALLSRLEGLATEKTKLQEELDKVTERESVRLEDLAKVEKAYLKLEKGTLDNMYNWLSAHQNKRTGLVASFEGDRLLKNTAFTYDQSLASQVFLLFGDAKKAGSILDFYDYRAQKDKDGFTNAYDVNTGDIVEYAVHSGPNIWLGIAIMQYVGKTGDSKYLDLAKYIADWIIKMQEEDPDKGVRGGPDMTWFGTEHNLDAYAFFTMLAQKTGSERYNIAAQNALNWIKKNAFTGNEGIINRGKGDSTIATDTFSWAIAAIGPERLLDMDMDPDAIMKFVEDNCKVTVDFKRPNGEVVKITGFDFAKERHLPRGGVVSSEWTAQIIVSLKMMSDFYIKMGKYKKAGYYQDLASFYINELEKMIVASPSRTGQGAGCLPYATLGEADTGHGWRTPKGKDTGSVSGTSYAIFAIKGYNPLKLASAE